MEREKYAARCRRVYDPNLPDPQRCSFVKGHLQYSNQKCGTDWDWCDRYNGGDPLTVGQDGPNDPPDFQETPASTKLEEELAAFIRATPEVFAGRISASQAATRLVEFLGGKTLLITNSRIHKIQEVDYLSTNGNESIDWTVYTEPEDNA